VNLVAFTGDLVALTGSEHDRELAKSYVDLFSKPKAIMAGNHEFTYQDIRGANGKLVHASLPEQQAKLQAFQADFGLKHLYRAKKMGPYELIFLSPEPVTGKHLCEISPPPANLARQTTSRTSGTANPNLFPCASL
jgi:Icc protein